MRQFLAILTLTSLLLTACRSTLTPRAEMTRQVATELTQIKQPTETPTPTPTSTPTSTPTPTQTPEPTNTPTSTPTPKPTKTPTPTPQPFWIRHRPSHLPVIECPDENPENGILESSNPNCRVTRSFWGPDGQYWGPIVKDDNAMNVDFNCIPPGNCVPSSEEMKVFAVDDGIVRHIDYLSDSIGYKVEVQHADGMIGNYGHISDPREFVQVGQSVKGGQQIGAISASWDYFLAFSLFKKSGSQSIHYNPFDFDLTVIP